MFDFLDKFLQGQNGIQTSFDADVAGAVGGLAGTIFAGGVAKENAETRRLVARINTQATARETRYNLGMSKVVQAAQSGGYSETVFRAAENAREAERAMNRVRIDTLSAEVAAQSESPSVSAGILDFAGDFINARASRNAKVSQQFEGGS